MNLFSRLTAWAQPYLVYIELAAIAALVISAFVAGVRWESNARDAQQVDLVNALHGQYIKQVAAWNKRAGELIAANTKAKSELRKLRVRIKQDEAAVYKPTPDATPVTVPGWTVTTDHVRLWNDALCQGITAGECGAPQAPGTTGVAQGTTLTRQDLLENHAENTAICNDIRRQLDKLIDGMEAREHGTR